ncbi:M3 family metallopeptidase [Paucibacter sp. DJ2R-2]|uniref:M3 family metallopeptidase n=1 Tax=Paucibacter sp. DJ2R-2 TaxID=2893558 RepID=UPI0021E4E54E|nr:M3 family metallopeptidase [Paucibacter sp. DJ2R-2]MCV2419967.1 M3 family metallopeptidase [Paucibacter sp. DJ4R-1]MCV2437106.1 M3 family metallopeptidase [Paucibacter sp. DJ2R-2]
MERARAFFDQLNLDYNRVHKTKEDLFWATYMATSEDQAGFERAEGVYKDFISDPARLADTREHIARVQAAPDRPEREALLHGLRGWLAVFEANIIDNEAGRALMAGIIEAESRIFAAKRELQPRHINEAGESEVASLSMLATNLATNPDEARRRSSLEAYYAIERWVLANGFLDLVRLRNRFARALGFDNYFELKLRKNERMTPQQLKDILDDFVQRTDVANARALANLSSRHGEQALQPWNLRFYSAGDVVRRMDAYMPFGPALRRWVQSFRRLGIQYRGATLQLDLLERAGKYQNGFCHGPIPSHVDAQGRWVPGQINFTAEAKPDQVGSGLRAINTLFHEGGHAAHFANVVQNSPCFSQEFAPTSMAYAETQSMFCDSLLGDADWLKRYARNAAGEAIPDELIHARIASSQPMRAFDERSIAVVPYFEAALYAMPDDALTAENVLALARATELRVLGVHSPRPMLAIPHLLNQESAASYQGYLLAHMAVYQTRAFFLREHGYLSDNPAIGPALSAHYWEPGNSIDHDATLRSLTGEGFSARYLAEACNQSVEDCWAEAQASMAAAAQRQYPSEFPAALAAEIRIVHGDQLLADNREGDEAMCSQFEAWIAANYSISPAALAQPS